jgi:hypothetical protein
MRGRVVNRVKREILAGTSDPELRERLASFPGRYFQVAFETCDDPADRESILMHLVELYGAHVEQIRRRADASEARLAVMRRRRLRVLPDQSDDMGA